MKRVVLITFLSYFSFIIPLNETRLDNISIIGIGRLGICMALCFEKAGYSVLGMDINQPYIDAINSKTFNSAEPLVNEYLKKSKNFRATSSIDEILEFSNILFILVPTPTAPGENTYDHSYINAVLSEINKRKVKDKHIVLSCTIAPGYIKKEASPLLKDCQNVSLSYNPEFISQGNIIKGLENPDLVLIGEGSEEVGNMLEQMYLRICSNNPLICRMTPSSAEITKLATNCFITTKIAFANMIGDIADLTEDANKYQILDTVGKDSRIGNKCLNPGYGFGGPCFPRDNRALGCYAQKIGIFPFIPMATDQSNKHHTEFMTQKFKEENREIYVFEDINYKENCNVVILDESQKLAVALNLAQDGKKVLIKDKKAVIAILKQQYGNLFEYSEL